MGSNKDLSRVLNEWFDNKLFEIHTHIPGKIVSYSATERKAKVQPLIKIRDNNNDTFQIDPIDNVPVIFPSTAKFNLVFPLEKDDGCLLLFSEVSLGNYLNGKGNIVDADDSNRFELTDCICIPGLWGLKNTPTLTGVNNTDVFIKFNNSKIVMESGGSVKINNNLEVLI